MRCGARERVPVAADFGGVIGALADAGVEVIVIGELAAQAHGAARLTQDADFIYRAHSRQHRSSSVRARAFSSVSTALIHAKRAVGRPRELEARAELEALLAEIENDAG